MTESKEGGVPTAADAPVSAKGVGDSTVQDPVSLPDLSTFEPRVREIQRLILTLSRDIPQGKKSVSRNVKKMMEGSRLLLSAITMNEDMRVHSEPAVSGVEFTTTPYQTLLVPSDDIKAEGF